MRHPPLACTTCYCSQVLKRSSKVKCRAFPYSTDAWSSFTIKNIDANVATQKEQVPKTEASALVLGPGGLLFFLGHLSVNRITMSDLHDDVFGAMDRRFEVFSRSKNWDDYHAGASEGLRGWEKNIFDIEWENATTSGLRGDFAHTQEGFNATQVNYVQGDFRTTAPLIASEATRRGEMFTFINLTNASLYAKTGRLIEFKYDRMESLGHAVGSLPLSPQAMIIDSTDFCYPHQYTQESYPGVTDAVAVRLAT